MSYMDQNVAVAPAGGIQELSFDEVARISGGDIGDSTVAGTFAGAGAGWRIARGASWGARLGAFAGPVGAVVGGLGGGVIAFAIYRYSSERANDE